MHLSRSISRGRYPARVVVELNSGATRDKTIIEAPGDPSRALTMADVEAKGPCCRSGAFCKTVTRPSAQISQR